jgi:hypothetical protein
MPNRILPVLLLVATLGPVSAQQADRSPGHVAARAFATAPAPLAFAVEPDDNSTENMALAERIAKEAGARGMTIQRGGPLVLRLDTEVRTNVRAPRQTFSREGGGLTDIEGVPPPPDTRGEVANLVSSCGAGAIGARPAQTDYTRCLRYVVNATLEDRGSGRRLWQGHVSYDSNAPDRTAMFVALAPALVEQIGKSVQQRAFRLE